MKSKTGVTGKQLLSFLQKLSPAELKKPVIFLSDEFSLSIPVTEVAKQPFPLLWDGEGGSGLYSKAHFLRDGMEADEIGTLVEEVAKGDIVLK